jgi:hypothetical protein
MYCLLLLNMDRYIIIKKIAGSKHPELIRDVISYLSNLSEPSLEIRYSNVENFYMIKVSIFGISADEIEPFIAYNSLRERFSSERVYEEYKVKIYYFDQLFTIEFEDLNVPYWSLMDVARSEPIFLPTYNPNLINEQEWRNLSF